MLFGLVEGYFGFQQCRLNGRRHIAGMVGRSSKVTVLSIDVDYCVLSVNHVHGSHWRSVDICIFFLGLW